MSLPNLSDIHVGDEFVVGRITVKFHGWMGAFLGQRQDWIAYITADRGYWGRGDSIAEAIGQLYLSHPRVF